MRLRRLFHKDSQCLTFFFPSLLSFFKNIFYLIFRHFFSAVYNDPTSAIMVTPLGEEGGKWKDVLSQRCGDCLSGQGKSNPQNFSPSELFIQARNNSSGISLHRPNTASPLSFAPLPFHLLSDLLYISSSFIILFTKSKA